jgi:hypothetical protein
MTVTVLAADAAATAAPTQESSSATSSSSSQDVAFGVGFGVLALIVIVIAIVIVARLRYKAKAKPYDFAPIVSSLTELATIDDSNIPDEVPRESVNLLDKIGSGNFGEVHKALYSEKRKGSSFLVAVKSLHASADSSSKSDLMHEAAIMAQFRSPRVVQLVGVCTIGEPCLMIVEYCELGALNKFLQTQTTDLILKTRIAGDCAEGLSYLSARGFVHRDVAARNVLVGSDKRAKISDFGMSRDMVGSEYYRSRGGQIPVRWTAPEVR